MHLPEKAAKIVLGLVDLVLLFDTETVTDSGKPATKSIIRTKPTGFCEAGDRTGRLPETLPLDYHAFTEAFKKAVAGAQINDHEQGNQK